MLKLLAVIGSPVAHSLSPVIHDAFIKEAGLDYRYLPFEIAPGDAGRFFEAASLLGIAGFNVTMPHKESAFALCGEIHGEASRGTVNTVVPRDGVFHGYTTDGDGLLRAMNGAGFPARGSRVLVLGYGGAGKSAAAALARVGAEITVLARDAGKALAQGAPGRVLSLDALPEACRNADILINATPLGMEGFAEFPTLDFLTALPRGALVFDLIYAPRRTAMLEESRRLGLRSLGGVALLVHQAALSFELFTGHTPSAELADELIRKL